MSLVQWSARRRAAEPFGACALLLAALLRVGSAAAADTADADAAADANATVDVSTRTRANTETNSSTETATDWEAPGRSSVPAPAFASSPRLHHRTDFSPQNMAFELRFGPYNPRLRPVAQEFYGDKTRYQLGIEVDGQLWRAPHVGTLGVGFGWSYTKESAIKLLKDDTLAAEQPNVAEKSTLHIMPMYAVGVLRVDVLARELGIPLVGYGKFGLGYGLWWESDGNGLVHTETVQPDRSTRRKAARDGSVGTQAALGAMFLLDWLEPAAGVELDTSSGINNSYLFLEWSVSKLAEGSGDVGTNTWVAGLAIEL